MTEFKCHNCENKIVENDENNKKEKWFIDNLEYNDRRRESNQNIYFHMCPDCRRKNAIKYPEGSVKCERCYESGDWAEGKWGVGHRHNYLLNLTLCYECHECLYYNK